MKSLTTGRLKHYRLPGSLDRRILPADLKAFLEREGIPMPDELRIKTVAPMLAVTGAVGTASGEGFDFVQAFRTTIRPATCMWLDRSLLDLAYIIGQQRPDVALLGCDEGLSAALGVVRMLLTHKDPTPKVLLVLDDSTDPLDSRIDGVRDRLAWIGRRPHDWQEAVASLGLTRSGNDEEEQGASPRRAG